MKRFTAALALCVAVVGLTAAGALTRVNPTTMGFIYLFGVVFTSGQQQPITAALVALTASGTTAARRGLTRIASRTAAIGTLLLGERRPDLARDLPRACQVVPRQASALVSGTMTARTPTLRRLAEPHREPRDTAAQLGPNFRAVVESSPNYSLREQLRIPMAVRRERPDVMLHVGYNPDITLFLRQSKEAGLKWAALIGHGAGYGQIDKLIETFGKDVNYFFNVDPVAAQLLDPKTLKPGVANPYSYIETPAPTPIEDDPERMRELFARNGAVRRVDFDPVTRVAGALAFHTVVDLENRQVMETASMATLFRGYEIILKGRDPRDAIFISSRACGVCGGVHANTAALLRPDGAGPSGEPSTRISGGPSNRIVNGIR